MDGHRKKFGLWVVALSLSLFSTQEIFSLDEDGDGLSDVFEASVGTDLQGAEGDDDFDGFSNLEEFFFGGDPLDAEVLPSFVSFSEVDGELIISWGSRPSLSYQLQRFDFTLGPTGDWVDEGERLTAMGSSVSVAWDDFAVNDSAIFRVAGFEAEGDVGITVTRTAGMVAPDGIRLEADFSAGFFDTPARTGTMLDEQFRDIVCTWDLSWSGGALAPFDAPEHATAQTRRRDRLYGPLVSVHAAAHEHGTWTATLTAWEPSSGKTASSSVSFNVADPDAYADFQGANTVCISTGNDFAEAPAGAQTFGSGDIAGAFAAYKALPNGRLLFKAGDTFQLANGEMIQFTDVANDPTGLYVGKFGTGVNPVILQAPNPTNVRNSSFLMFSVVRSWTTGVTQNRDFRLSDLDIQGPWDILSETGTANSWVGAPGKVNSVFDNVHVDGMFNYFGSDDADEPMNCFIANGSSTNRKSYALFITSLTAHPDSFIGVSGNLWTLPEGAQQKHDDEGGDVSADDASGAVRIQDIGKIYMAGNDIYSAQADSVGTFQTLLRIFSRSEHTDPHHPGGYANIVGNVLEGGLAMNSDQEISVEHNRSNILFVNNIYIASPFAAYCAEISSLGFTAYNNMILVPEQQAVSTFRAAFRCGPRPNDSSIAIPPTTTVNPVQVYNNTMWVHRSNSNNNGTSVSNDFVRNFGVTYDKYEADNVILSPGNTSVTPVNISDILFPSRYAGRRQEFEDTVDPAYETPDDTARLVTPIPGSSAIDAVASPRVNYDLNGNPVATPGDAGAIQN